MVLLLSILKCLEEPKLSFKKRWTADFLAAGSAGIGAILYYGGLKLSARLTGISLIENNYNSVSNAWKIQNPWLRIFCPAIREAMIKSAKADSE